MTLLTHVIPMEIPSPTQAVWQLGPFPLRAYALCILAGIVAATWITQRRLSNRGGSEGDAIEIATWAVPFGIVGGRLYHVITTPQPYFGSGGNPMNAFRIWEGGMGIWGAVALGALGAWIGCRRKGIAFADFADSAAPGVAIAQAMGRFGNFFNNEIYGPRVDGPSAMPWALRIHEWDHTAGRAIVGPDGQPVVLGWFHPTFLYEALWCLALAAVLLWMGRRWKRGQVFAGYVMGYPLGRVFIEMIRTDDANRIMGLRVNVWVSVAVFVLGVYLFFWYARRARFRGLLTAPACPQDDEQPGRQVDLDEEDSAGDVSMQNSSVTKSPSRNEHDVS